MRALQIAATGMSAQQTRVEVISNNLANMYTTGYNARRAEFADLHYQQLARPGTINASDGSVLPTGVQLGLGVRPSAVSMMLAARARWPIPAAISTSRSRATGYIEVELPDGRAAYTRDGALKRSADGLIVNVGRLRRRARHHHPAGRPVDLDQRRGRGLRLFRRPVAARAHGPDHAGRLHQREGPRGDRLEHVRRNHRLRGRRWSAYPARTGSAPSARAILEDSSVDAVREVTELIEAQRGYELNSKVITAADQMLAATTQVR